ncbi:hypothetical protein [Teredinibacter sp. KSP-S5-2]|uniref:hypothetical protein n=1 Tax=Teredinibacter sp. KSP-S5-2 TaxID=3034506 RepID=UPI0029342BAF|nr:hypothetical protein [Teredinibacter sp. KSP-S5-2]WNO10785.1 hypothetical protein P5V12_06305 [Teredinibacter sp. KSP-S5-2]
MNNFYKLLFMCFTVFHLSSCKATSRGDNFVTFETGQVNPIAISDDGKNIFALNTPNSSLEIFSVTSSGLSLSESIDVGMEPTSIAVLSNKQVWVVNHLSDSVSIIDISEKPAKIIRTLLVGDEPRDIVFAGNNNRYAFITAAHRGQNGRDDRPIDAKLTEPGIGRADVWVFDTMNLGETIGGDPVDVINLFGDTPRSLTVSPDGKSVFASIFLSGNQTTSLGVEYFAKHGPTTSIDGTPQPDTGLIVQFDGNQWVDENGNAADQNGTNYGSRVLFSLPDYDVFRIDIENGKKPKLSGTPYSGVGTVLLNMITNPRNGALYVTNLEALNVNRFEGPGTMASSVRGHFTENHISVIKNNSVSPRHLNKHIDYTQFPGTKTERDSAISYPTDMAITSDGKTLYVAGFGSSNIAVINTQELENNSFQPSPEKYIRLSGGGPSGIALDETNNRLYVLTRFDNSVSVIDTKSKNEVSRVAMYNPEPDSVIEGRPFLYDSIATSSRGDSSCALCHVYGDFDGLAWDLGDPDAPMKLNPNGYVDEKVTPPYTPYFHPLKGPMTTQSMRGLKGNGPMHWRGDRTGAQAKEGESIEFAALKEFNAAFTGLVGRENQLSETDIDKLSRFGLEITYPPNPIRALDNSLTPMQQAGLDVYNNDITTGVPQPVHACNQCHVLDPVNNKFGTGALSVLAGPDITQEFKVPHLRNLYQKIGRFGNSGRFFTDGIDYGEQIKGFGFLHDGTLDTLDKFLKSPNFHFETDLKRDQVVDFILAIDSELAPVVGQQITLTKHSDTKVHERIDLLRSRAQIVTPREECDLVVKGVIDGQQRSYLMHADGSYQSDKIQEVLNDSELRKLVSKHNQTLTFTCVPPGSGIWMGIDHDEDGIYDGDEKTLGTDPLTPDAYLVEQLLTANQ